MDGAAGPQTQRGDAAVRFSGFSNVMVAVLADDAELCERLLEIARPETSATLVVHDGQPLSARLESSPSLYDPWLDVACMTLAGEDPASAERLDDPSELARFYVEQGVHHYQPDMFAFGHYHGVRAPSGELVSAGGLNFLLDVHDYAHIGGLVTVANARGRGHGTRVLRAIGKSLAARGIARVGLFADAGDPSLADFYVARGFRLRGRIRFVEL